MKDTYILLFQNRETNETFDIEVPKQITANELIVALNQGLHLRMDLRDIPNCFLRTENPVALLRGDKLLEEYELHDGSILCYEGMRNG